MTFEDDFFNVVLDRGTLDALMLSATDNNNGQVICIFQQIRRILKLGGRYIFISFAQENVLRLLVDYFSDE